MDKENLKLALLRIAIALILFDSMALGLFDPGS